MFGRMSETNQENLNAEPPKKSRSRKSRAKEQKAEPSTEPSAEHSTKPSTEPSTEPSAEPSAAVAEADSVPPKEPPTPFAWEAPEGFQKLPQDFLIYSPDAAQGRSILCIPLDVIDMPRDKSTIKALVCMLLEPTPLVDADGTIVHGQVGQEVLVECGHFVRRLVRAALDPKNVGEVWMRAIGKLRAEGGDSITLWDIRYGKVYPRDKIKRIGR